MKKPLTRQMSIFEPEIVTKENTHTYDTRADFERKVILESLSNWEEFIKQLNNEKWPEGTTNKANNAGQ